MKTTQSEGPPSPHIASWSGKVAMLPEVAPPSATLSELLAIRPRPELMRPGSDPQQRQHAFDQRTMALAVSMRREVERLEVSGRASNFGIDLLLLESPEALPFSEDVRIAMTHIQPAGVRVPIGLAVLSDGAELRAYVGPLSNFNVPIELSSGEYEVRWTITPRSLRSNASDADSTFTQQTTMTLRI